ncbi:MAG: LamB/YcsF family protein [Ilumatobacteraceae bacterium]|nr:LamB/YcsF family protein [Ilumatobacteraceae bacterium]
MPSVDLNSDLGEGFGIWRLGDDAAMLQLVTSANIACGFHAGDPSTLRAVCLDAVKNDVRIGAQVSYPDLVGFGRRHIDMEPAELTDVVLYQLGALDAFAQVAGSEVSYVKPHGALYHAACAERRVADAVVEAVADYDHSMSVLGLPGSALLDAADAAGLEVAAEAFADRAYSDDGGLVDRAQPGAVLEDPRAIAERAVQMVMTQTVTTFTGKTISVPLRSLCVHGDTPGAVEIARAVRDALEAEGIGIYSFT